MKTAKEHLKKCNYIDQDEDTVYINEDAVVECMEDYAKQYALNLFEQYLDGEKTMAEISQELKQE